MWIKKNQPWAKTVFSCFAGGNHFIKDIEMMLGKKSFLFWLWWRACWFFISPCIIVVSTATLQISPSHRYQSSEYAWLFASRSMKYSLHAHGYKWKKPLKQIKKTANLANEKIIPGSGSDLNWHRTVFLTHTTSFHQLLLNNKQMQIKTWSVKENE